MDYRFEEMVRDCVRDSLRIKHTIFNDTGKDYILYTELFWRDSFMMADEVEIPKDPGLKLAEKL